MRDEGYYLVKVKEETDCSAGWKELYFMGNRWMDGLGGEFQECELLDIREELIEGNQIKFGQRHAINNNTLVEYRGVSREATNNWCVGLGKMEHEFHVISSDSELVLGRKFWLGW